MESILLTVGTLSAIAAVGLLFELTRQTKRMADVLEISHEAEIRGVKSARLIDEERRRSVEEAGRGRTMAYRQTGRSDATAEEPWHG